MLAVVHLTPNLSIPLALVLSVGLTWYWLRMGRAEVPRSRRMIRRSSVALMLLSLPVFVHALSFANPQLDPKQYITMWLLGLVLMLGVVATAVADVFNNLRLHSEDRRRALIRSALETHGENVFEPPQSEATSNGASSGSGP